LKPFVPRRVTDRLVTGAALSLSSVKADLQVAHAPDEKMTQLPVWSKLGKNTRSDDEGKRVWVGGVEESVH
jgi:hypothetical protein